MTLRIRLLGGVELDEDGARLRIDSSRVESLLAYLLLHRETPQSRQHLAYLLWPDTNDAQARTNLRHVLHTLRRTLRDAERVLDITPRTLQWRADAAWELDVADFESALAAAMIAADSDPARSTGMLRAAVDLYRGELVTGCYDEWLVAAREQYRQQYLDALSRLIPLLEAEDEVPQAIARAEQLMAADPLREETYRVLMRLHAGRGDRARAIRVYHAGASTLERELGVPPSAATRQVYDTLLATEGDEVGDTDLEPLAVSPYVGRTRERSALTAAWRSAAAGRSALVILTGEAGIGKTRLVEDFRAWCAHRGAQTALARSYAAEGAPAYGPVAAWLRSPAIRRDLTRLGGRQLVELARLVPELLVEIPGPAPPQAGPESDQRQALFDAVARALLHAGRPLLLIADDAHWCDRESLQLLHYLLRVAPGARLLVVVTARTEEIQAQSALSDLLRGLRALDRLTEIELARLSRSDTAALAERLGVLTGPESDQLWSETEGNPLFVVEAVRAGWPGGGGLSPRVQAVIESRLAQLSDPARELVGMAATIGRDFTVELLIEATQWDEDAVVGHLDELWRRRLVREQSVSGNGGFGQDGRSYDFSHDKIRAVAYAGVSPIRRRHHHLSIARALERSSPADSGELSAQIAMHYDKAGAASDATTWYLLAARAAQQLQAGADAIRLLERARDVLLTLPTSVDRNRRELTILTALPGPLASVEGYASSRLSAVHDDAIELARDTGCELAPPLLWSLAFSGLVREDFARSERYAGELRTRGEQTGEDVLVVQGCCLLGLAAFWRVDLVPARRHLEAALDHYQPDQLATHLLGYGQDPQVLALARLGNIHWFLGDRQAATKARDAALARADAIGHGLTKGAALVFAALLALDMGDDRLVRQYSAELNSLAHDALPVRYFTHAIGGYVEVLAGETAAGLRRISTALTEVAANPPAPGMWAIVQRIQLAACVAAGDADNGIRAAGRLIDSNGPAQLWAPEARRRSDFFAGGSNRNG